MQKRDKEIAELKEQLTINHNDSNELVKKIESLERQINEVESAPEILEKIREKMVHKGFLSDKELEQILEEFE